MGLYLPSTEVTVSKFGIELAAKIPTGEIDFVPVADFILVEPIEKGQTRGGIALPEGVDPDPPKAKVLRVGPGRVSEMGARIPMPVAEGDVVYALAAGTTVPINLGGRKCVILRARDLIGIEAKKAE